MRYIVTAAQMKEADMRTIHDVGIPSLVLMERAALSCINIMKQEGVDISNPLIVCGSGNNGGDGFAIARLLSEEGIFADVVLVGRMESRSEETRTQMEILRNLGVSVGNCLPDREYSVIIDAVFGIGLTRPIEGTYKEIIEQMNSYDAEKVAVDIPSGICADTGKVLGTAFKADITVTFAYAKRGHIFYPGSELCGQVFVMPIGIEAPGLGKVQDVSFALDMEDIWKLKPERPADSNKGCFGKMLLVAGSKGMCGAAYLSAGAAYAAGAGLVRVYTEESNREILQGLLPEAVLTTYDERDGESAVRQLAELLDWADVACMGCGLGKGRTAVMLTEALLEFNRKPCVLDADALNILGENHGLMEILKSAKADYILTPHMKEMSRLAGHTVQEWKKERVELVRDFVKEYPAVCVLKDARTLAAAREKQLFINTSGNAAMAKAGAGDVLAGLTAGLLAQGLPGWEAAVLGVYLHGLAGERAAADKGMYSVLARDIIDGIGMTWKSLEEQHEDLQQNTCSHRFGRSKA
ncbi:bifunctional ADP-dependent NAD(P)H-hydrate dehydratase/NAD(P)H-hydrate epimerase [Bariatricus massiliensis]|uniref:Bifunctional NAD(P)H-hydrate repair enzyme n=1 Tax=Bariatricus massiliensis TaxID=1745713 RepID=A0ABS8DC93_9FIRM|nr:bifunctional ADP-dependent NAD(P)H-hydrate dehydratase/NAD(P)H-hydrate epimerase [Bariatricus massiliensis]MCB7303224.1 bifunctional ADP-dependent NAD(P)H-hydrate dehydratase/NAD(P)H-hydrate epimerase [Bariatricus massiliensis]MCB7373356.1 bifunctional ADP-dependent NAD(P)H-hydrate dehydratase/NAD(P)H-hydrate epimerase [Bariatricus massiliensis]MCB7386026.1 bifunctional ADP-dependent NAD(P)H-hydrate dehydratase/NAD(P)H-hydrate epimerase [Bariatricus massiliensis]MCB7410188.1 bifunctional ADP